MTAALPRARAVEALWDGLRLAVVDVETTYNKTAGTKVVSVGLVTCRSGRVQGRWGSLVNPGVPIRLSDTRVHGLRDEDVEGAPAFDAVAGTLLAALTEEPGERLVVVAHNAAFDVPVLRDELAAAQLTMPDLPILDTMGRLPETVGVRLPGKSLDALLTALGMRNENPHDALADADAAARAVCELLARAAENGTLDIDSLLKAVEATTTLTQAASKGAHGADLVAEPVLSPEHLTTHGHALNAKPAARTVARWTAALTDCGRQRCSHAAARVESAQAPPDLVIAALSDALADVAADQDGPAVATLLDAAGPVLCLCGAGLTPRRQRSTALALFRQWSGLTAGVTRCDKDLCPACRDGRACGVDTWTYYLAGAAVAQWTRQSVSSFLPYTGSEARRGISVWSTWTKHGDGPLADAALWRCYEFWVDNNQQNAASMMAETAWRAGARHPRVTEAYVDAITAGGRPADFQSALDVADTTLSTDPQLGPPEHWRSLRARRTWLAGQLDRGRVRYSGQLDPDGNPVPIRRHHPDSPRRSRPTRFLRQPGRLDPVPGPHAQEVEQAPPS